MKKIIFILLSLMMFANVANADILEENNNEWQKEKIEGENVELQYRYRFYRDIEFGDYIRLGDISEYKYENKDDIRYGEYSDFKEVCYEKNGYEIEKSSVSEVQELLPIQFVKITNTSNEILNIKKVEIKNLDTLVNYEIYSSKNTSSNNMLINPGGNIIFWMSYSVPIGRFTFIFDVSNINAQYEILFSNGRYFTHDVLVAKTNGDSNRKIYNYDNNYTLYDNYSQVFTRYNVVLDDFTRVLSEKEVCREREIMTYRYNIKKEYYDDNYYVSVDDLEELEEAEREEYTKDENDVVIYYRYKNNSKDEVVVDKNANVDFVVKDNSSNNILLENKEIKNEYNDIKLVKTGIDESVNYKFLNMYILLLILSALIFIKIIKSKNNVE